MRQSGGASLQSVRVAGVTADPSAGEKVYNPRSPDAGSDGFVTMPNVNLAYEMVDLITASRAYEANLSFAKNARLLAEKTLELGNKPPCHPSVPSDRPWAPDPHPGRPLAAPLHDRARRHDRALGRVGQMLDGLVSAVNTQQAAADATTRSVLLGDSGSLTERPGNPPLSVLPPADASPCKTTL